MYASRGRMYLPIGRQRRNQFRGTMRSVVRSKDKYVREMHFQQRFTKCVIMEINLITIHPLETKILSISNSRYSGHTCGWPWDACRVDADVRNPLQGNVLIST